MKALVVYYSRTGNTRKVAHEIAGAFGADIEEIREKADRGGIIGWLGAGKDASEKKPAELLPSGKKPEEYDLIVVGTPIWAFTLPPPIRTWLDANKGKVKKFAAFCTCGGSGGEKNFAEMETVLGMKTVAKMCVFERELKMMEYKGKISEFCGKLEK
jgi:flavodoxin